MFSTSDRITFFFSCNKTSKRQAAIAASSNSSRRNNNNNNNSTLDIEDRKRARRRRRWVRFSDRSGDYDDDDNHDVFLPMQLCIPTLGTVMVAGSPSCRAGVSGACVLKTTNKQ